MNKKTIEQIELMLRREVMRLEKSFNEDLVRNSSTMRVLSERVRAMEEKDVVKSISIILAKCDFCYNNNKNRYLCTKNIPCQKCIYDFLVNRIGSINIEEKKPNA